GVDGAGWADVARVLPDGGIDVAAVEMGADRVADAEVWSVRDKGQVEVAKLDDAVRADGDVARPDVAVDDAAAVGVGQAGGHALDDLRFLIPGQLPLAVLVEDPFED